MQGYAPYPRKRSALMRPLTASLVLIIFVSSFGAVGAQSPLLLEVYVQVVDHDGQPLPAMTVYVWNAVGRTNATGVARLFLIAPGKYPVVVEDAFGSLLLPRVPDISQTVQVNQSGQFFRVEVPAKRVCLEVFDEEGEHPSWAAAFNSLDPPRRSVFASNGRLCMGLKEYTTVFVVAPFYRTVSIPAYSLAFLTSITLQRTANLSLTVEGRKLQVYLEWEALEPANQNITYALVIRFIGFDGRSRSLSLDSFEVKTSQGHRTWHAELPSPWGEGVAVAQVLVDTEQAPPFDPSRSWLLWLLYSEVGREPVLERSLLVQADQAGGSVWTVVLIVLPSTLATVFLALYLHSRRLRKGVRKQDS